jgi:hypothetical protein
MLGDEGRWAQQLLAPGHVNVARMAEILDKRTKETILSTSEEDCLDRILVFRMASSDHSTGSKRQSPRLRRT